MSPTETLPARIQFQTRPEQYRHWQLSIESDVATLRMTVDPDGAPSVRIVLCSAIDVGTAAFSFFTNRLSRKGRALAAEGLARQGRQKAAEFSRTAGLHLDQQGLALMNGHAAGLTDRL